MNSKEIGCPTNTVSREGHHHIAQARCAHNARHHINTACARHGAPQTAIYLRALGKEVRGARHGIVQTRRAATPNDAQSVRRKKQAAPLRQWAMNETEEEQGSAGEALKQINDKTKA